MGNKTLIESQWSNTLTLSTGILVGGSGNLEFVTETPSGVIGANDNLRFMSAYDNSLYFLGFDINDECKIFQYNLTLKTFVVHDPTGYIPVSLPDYSTHLTIGNTLYIIGGSLPNKTTIQIIIVNLATKVIELFDTLLVKTVAGIACSKDNLIYFGSGVASSFSVNFYSFNIENRQILPLCNLPGDFSSCCCEVYNNQIFFLGAGAVAPMSDCYVYDILTNAFSIYDTNIDYGYIWSASAIIEDNIIIFGGMNPATGTTGKILKYNITSKTKTVIGEPTLNSAVVNCYMGETINYEGVIYTFKATNSDNGDFLPIMSISFTKSCTKLPIPVINVSTNTCIFDRDIIQTPFTLGGVPLIGTDIQIATDIDFNNIVLTETQVKDFELNSYELNDDTDYYVRTRYNTSKGRSSFSNIEKTRTSKYVRSQAIKINEIVSIDQSTNSSVYHEGRIYYIGVAPNPNFNSEPNCTCLIEFDFLANVWNTYYPTLESLTNSNVVDWVYWKRKRGAILIKVNDVLIICSGSHENLSNTVNEFIPTDLVFDLKTKLFHWKSCQMTHSCDDGNIAVLGSNIYYLGGAALSKNNGEIKPHYVDGQLQISNPTVMTQVGCIQFNATSPYNDYLPFHGSSYEGSDIIFHPTARTGGRIFAHDNKLTYIGGYDPWDLKTSGCKTEEYLQSSGTNTLSGTWKRLDHILPLTNFDCKVVLGDDEFIKDKVYCFGGVHLVTNEINHLIYEVNLESYATKIVGSLVLKPSLELLKRKNPIINQIPNRSYLIGYGGQKEVGTDSSMYRIDICKDFGEPKFIEKPVIILPLTDTLLSNKETLEITSSFYYMEGIPYEPHISTTINIYKDALLTELFLEFHIDVTNTVNAISLLALEYETAYYFTLKYNSAERSSPFSTATKIITDTAPPVGILCESYVTPTRASVKLIKSNHMLLDSEDITTRVSHKYFASIDRAMVFMKAVLNIKDDGSDIIYSNFSDEDVLCPGVGYLSTPIDTSTFKIRYRTFVPETIQRTMSGASLYPGSNENKEPLMISGQNNFNDAFQLLEKIYSTPFPFFASFNTHKTDSNKIYTIPWSWASNIGGDYDSQTIIISDNMLLPLKVIVLGKKLGTPLLTTTDTSGNTIYPYQLKELKVLNGKIAVVFSYWKYADQFALSLDDGETFVLKKAIDCHPDWPRYVDATPFPISKWGWIDDDRFYITPSGYDPKINYFFLSSDKGQTFTKITTTRNDFTSGSEGKELCSKYGTIVVSKSTYQVGTYPGPYTHHQYNSVDNGVTWNSLQVQYRFTDIQTIGNTNLAIAVGTTNTIIGLSSDGVTWTWKDLTVTSGITGSVYVFGKLLVISSSNTVFYVSSDLGDTWTHGILPHTQSILNCTIVNDGVTDNLVTVGAINSSSVIGVWISKDKALTWTKQTFFDDKKAQRVDMLLGKYVLHTYTANEWVFTSSDGDHWSTVRPGYSLSDMRLYSAANLPIEYKPMTGQNQAPTNLAIVGKSHFGTRFLLWIYESILD